MSHHQLAEHIQHADWKSEKHVPVIECPETVKADEMFQVKVTLGKEVAHPNTTEHHIAWVDVHFLPEGAKKSFQVARCEFSAHGQSVDGPNEGPVYTHHEMAASMKTSKGGMLYAIAYCNIHGLWEGTKEIKVG